MALFLGGGYVYLAYTVLTSRYSDYVGDRLSDSISSFSAYELLLSLLLMKKQFF